MLERLIQQLELPARKLAADYYKRAKDAGHDWREDRRWKEATRSS